jgi:hypothetical protein
MSIRHGRQLWKKPSWSQKDCAYNQIRMNQTSFYPPRQAVVVCGQRSLYLGNRRMLVGEGEGEGGEGVGGQTKGQEVSWDLPSLLGHLNTHYTALQLTYLSFHLSRNLGISIHITYSILTSVTSPL